MCDEITVLRDGHIDELAGLCDRVVVFHQGRVSAELSRERLKTHTVLEAMNTGELALNR